MSCRLVILTEIISPYRIPLFNTLAQRSGIDLHVIFLAETDPTLRQWRVYKEEIRFSYQVLASWRKHIGSYNVLLNRGVGRALRGAAPDVILCGGYNYAASWHALVWARIHKTPLFLWSESNLQDSRPGHALVERLKNEFLQHSAGFVVPGQSAREYLRSRKIEESCIFVAPNAVDNDLFAKAAGQARANAARSRAELCLPGRYILFVGRLVREKGVFDLSSAYGKLGERIREQVGLVFVGDGEARVLLQEQATRISPGTITFCGFADREQLGTYYALAEMLVLPTYTDTWGLVVNEAMACSLPVIVSRAAGCAPDMVREDWNGLVVSPGDVAALATAMQQLIEHPDECARMGANSLEHIAHFSPAEWALGIARSIGQT
jgi:glycosyltransferase involved in cell wall biosynthesis